MPAELSLACPAKVNLSLRVHGRRPDGFHEISTVLQTIDLCDRLVIHRADPASPLRIEVPGGGAPADDSNLVLKAARAFFGVLGEPAGGVRFRLEKRIPAGSGLGGGSSDAAAALLGLQSLWGEPLDARQLHGAGAAVGSDVPFFLEGGTAFATGRGERVESLDDMPSATVLVVVPAVEVSTAEVYGDWKGAMAAGSRGEEGLSTLLPPPSRRGDAAAWVLGNDLEPVVRRLHPEVDGLLLALGRAGSTGGGGGPQVSGSGGAVFAVGEAPGIQAALAGTGVRVFRTRTLPREVRGLFM
ncbi:MAG: 4-(cytidine 5'-diphospho)-2-C-methyl-D-erythritol kinase [Acidobacteriota bacterium]|nr:4-(cytidine 5'-diphospho)-2-C-methyl-D-erythritol kinase [Acidobacteriota bacterium]